MCVNFARNIEGDMADTYNFKIEDLKQQIQHVFAMYNVLKEEKETLVKEKINLIQIIEEQNSKITDLEKKHKTLLMARAVSQTEGDTDLAKKRIDGLVREIDKCISLLTK